MNLVLRSLLLVVIAGSVCGSASLCLAGPQTSPAPQPSPPGSLQLLPGYQHERIGGMDTIRGRIWKVGGPDVIYEFGTLATNEARMYRQSNVRLWWRTFTTQKGSVEVVMTDDETMHIAFAAYLTNFTASRLKTKTDVADVMLMLMSFDPAQVFK